VGVVERESLIDGSIIAEGDVLVGIPSSGVHTNGFRLVHHVFKTEEEPGVLHHRYDDLNHSLGEELLIPHRCYHPMLEPVLPMVKGMAHISGGGLIGNLPRTLPHGLAARLQLGSWEVQPIFSIIQREGGVAREEMFRVFNMGLGMVLACDPEKVEELQGMVPEARLVGEVTLQSSEDRVVIEAA
jgi:phosphoribosylformylglycinamidine cyclo-ligase